MPTIKVEHPFSLRSASDKPRREFGKGTHEISNVELNHWFIQACLEEGRASLVADAPPAEDVAEDAPGGDTQIKTPETEAPAEPKKAKGK